MSQDRLWVDFNHRMEEGDYPLTTLGSLRDIERVGPLHDGQLIIIYMDEGNELVEINAVVRIRRNWAGHDYFTAFVAEDDPGH